MYISKSKTSNRGYSCKLQCDQCEIVFSLSHSKYKKTKMNFCSNRCQGDWLMEQDKVHSVFNIFDTEQEVYWLGFLLADGWLSKQENSYRIGLGLAEKDKNHLYKFAKFIGQKIRPTKKIDKTRNKVYLGNRVTLYNQDSCRRLMAKGMRFNKSLDGKPLPNISPKLIHHLIRGIFDGDGCVRIRQKRLRIEIADGNPITLIDIQQRLKKMFCTKSIYIYQKGIHKFVLSINKKSITKAFYEYIYKNATLFLSRKKYIFDSILKSRT